MSVSDISAEAEAPLEGIEAAALVPFSEAVRVWTRVGLQSFGGPAGQIAVMHRTLVDEKRWVSESRFLHALNYCMLLPGPEAQQLATYMGWLLHGYRGGLVAGVLLCFPVSSPRSSSASRRRSLPWSSRRWFASASAC